MASSDPNAPVKNKTNEDLQHIRKADLENHNRDGGLWVLINNKVYDVQDLRFAFSLIAPLYE